MSVRKICARKGCRSSPRCDHPWWLDVMHEGTRWRMRVDDFALVRGASEPVTSKQVAERVWEPKFLAEIAAGRDPRIPPVPVRAAEATLTVADLLDRYFVHYVEAEGLRSKASIRSRLSAVSAVIGKKPAAVLETTEGIQSFKAAYRKGREVSTVNRALSVLRGAVNWARFQVPPLLQNSPFHRFGVSIRAKIENKRDRRILGDEERMLLKTSLEMESEEHAWVGQVMHDRIIGAIETCCRQVKCYASRTCTSTGSTISSPSPALTPRTPRIAACRSTRTADSRPS